MIVSCEIPTGCNAVPHKCRDARGSFGGRRRNALRAVSAGHEAHSVDKVDNGPGHDSDPLAITVPSQGGHFGRAHFLRKHGTQSLA
jgi:hypothetical protein